MISLAADHHALRWPWLLPSTTPPRKSAALPGNANLPIGVGFRRHARGEACRCRGKRSVRCEGVAHYATKADGGKGAARELVELILKSKGIWEEMIDKARA